MRESLSLEGGSVNEVHSNLTCMRVMGDVGNSIAGFQMDGYRGFLMVDVDRQSVHAMGWLDWVGFLQTRHIERLCPAYFRWFIMRVKSWSALSLLSVLPSDSGRGMGLIWGRQSGDRGVGEVGDNRGGGTLVWDGVS